MPPTFSAASRHSWFRNTSWSEVIESDFQARLKRAREKSQYLRIQAYYLVETHPEITLRLIEQFFIKPEPGQAAMALNHKAKALHVLGRIEQAISAYEDAIAWETKHPSWKTLSSLDLAYLVASNSLHPFYFRALHLIENCRTELAFPIQRYWAFGSEAIILQAMGREKPAKEAALKALEAAGAESSGFKFHKKLGLVEGPPDEFFDRIESIAA